MAEDTNTGSAPDLGGLVIPQTPSSSDSGNPAALGGASSSAETIRQRKKRSDAGQSRGTRGAQTSGSVPTLSQTQFAALYDPKIWAKALAAPADAMAAITGRKLWEVSANEREALGATGSIAAQCFAVADPRYLALSLALITVIDVYGVRFAMEIAEKKKEAEAKHKADAAARSGGVTH